MTRDYKIGDLITANFPWGQQELWNETHGYISNAIMKGDSLLVLGVNQKRLKVLTPQGVVGWISRTILDQ